MFLSLEAATSTHAQAHSTAGKPCGAGDQSLLIDGTVANEPSIDRTICIYARRVSL